MAWGWPKGLFLSPKREHVVSTCWLTRAGYTQDTDGCERYFSFEVFVNHGGLKKALWRQDRVLFELLSYMERRHFIPKAFLAESLIWALVTLHGRLLSMSCVSRVSYGINVADRAGKTRSKPVCKAVYWRTYRFSYQVPLSMGFSRQEYWSGLTYPSPGDLPNPGIEPRSPALQADSLPTESPGKESRAPKNWCFWTMVLKTLESPWTARKSKQSILKEIRP